MILTALREYAERHGLMEDTAFEERPVHWEIVVDGAGRYLGISPLLGTEPSRGKGRAKRGRKVKVPKTGSRTSGGIACFTADTIPRVLPGYAKAEAKRRGQPVKESTLKTLEHFISMIKEAAEKTSDPALVAVQKFYDKLAERPEIAEQVRKDLDEQGAKSSEWITFRISGADRLLPEEPAARSFWNKVAAERQKAESKEGVVKTRCLCCGKLCEPVKTFDKVKGVPGSQAETSLVSFDKQAFQSYGLDRGENAPLCRYCAEAAIRALNALLSDENSRWKDRDAQVVFCFWSREPADFDLSVLFSPDSQQVKRLFESAWAGRRQSVGALQENRFYCIALSGVGGRAMLREWIDEPVPKVKLNLAQWFQDIAIVLDRPIAGADRGDVYSAWPMWQLNSALHPDRRNRDRGQQVVIETSTALFRAALLGETPPLNILAAAVGRNRVDCACPPERAAVVRLCVNRLLRAKGGMEMPEQLDRDRKDPAYLCGRLFAVLASLQRRAIGNRPTQSESGQGRSTATIVDRYYGAASTAPATVFGTLLSLHVAHLKKLGSEQPQVARAIQKEIEDILWDVREFPRQLTLEEQALFALGYYHQRADFRKRPVEEGGTEGAEPDDLVEAEA